MSNVTLQLNASTVAGDWATLPAGASRSGTGDLGASTREVHTSQSDEIAVFLSELRGAVESIKRGAHSPSMPDSRTDVAQVSYGTPLMYRGMCFVIG
jgi:hypothetical protein